MSYSALFEGDQEKKKVLTAPLQSCRTIKATNKEISSNGATAREPVNKVIKHKRGTGETRRARKRERLQRYE